MQKRAIFPSLIWGGRGGLGFPFILSQIVVSLAAVFVSSHNALRDETKTAARETSCEQALLLGCDCKNSSMSASGTKKDPRGRGVGKHRRTPLPPFDGFSACLRILSQLALLTTWNEELAYRLFERLLVLQYGIVLQDRCRDDSKEKGQKSWRRVLVHNHLIL